MCGAVVFVTMCQTRPHELLTQTASKRVREREREERGRVTNRPTGQDTGLQHTRRRTHSTNTNRKWHGNLSSEVRGLQPWQATRHPSTSRLPPFLLLRRLLLCLRRRYLLLLLYLPASATSRQTRTSRLREPARKAALPPRAAAPARGADSHSR